MTQKEKKMFKENRCGLGLCVKQTLYCTRPGLIDFFIIDKKPLRTWMLLPVQNAGLLVRVGPSWSESFEEFIGKMS